MLVTLFLQISIYYNSHYYIINWKYDQSNALNFHYNFYLQFSLVILYCYVIRIQHEKNVVRVRYNQQHRRTSSSMPSNHILFFTIYRFLRLTIFIWKEEFVRTSFIKTTCIRSQFVLKLLFNFSRNKNSKKQRTEESKCRNLKKVTMKVIFAYIVAKDTALE